MIATRTIAILLTVMLSAGARAERTIATLEEDSHFYREALLIPETDFSLAHLRSLSSSYIARLRGRYSLICVYFCVSEWQAAPYLSGIGSTDGSYQLWLNKYHMNQRLSKPSAQLLVIGDDAAIRYVDSNGKIGLLILRGQSPYVFQVGHSSYDLVNVAFVPPPRNTTDLPARGFNIVFYIKAPTRVGEGIALDVLNYFVERLRLPLIDVVLRHDPWFMLGDLSPPVLSFFEHSSPPSAEEYRKSTTVACGYFQGKTSCKVWGPK